MALTEDQMERYSRHFVLEEIGMEGQEKLRDSRVLVVGAGALGSAAILYLAAAGVGTIGIMDGDRVELSNLQRQVLHSTGTIGQPKVRSAADRIHELDPDTEIITYPFRLTADNAEEIIAAYDLVVDAVDTFGGKLLINDACVRLEKPFVHAGIVRFGGQMMTYTPGQGPCLRCVLGTAPAPGSYDTCSTVGVLGAAVGVLGSMEAVEAIKVILGIGNCLTGRMLFWDGLTMETQIVEMGEASPYCRSCSDPAAISLKDLAADYN